MRFFGLTGKKRLRHGPRFGATITSHVFADPIGREKRFHHVVQFGETFEQPRMQGQHHFQGIRHEHIGERIFARREPEFGIRSGSSEIPIQVFQTNLRFFPVLGANLVELRVPIDQRRLKDHVPRRLGNFLDFGLLENGISGQTQLSRQITIDGARLAKREVAIFEDGYLPERSTFEHLRFRLRPCFQGDRFELVGGFRQFEHQSRWIDAPPHPEIDEFHGLSSWGGPLKKSTTEPKFYEFCASRDIQRSMPTKVPASNHVQDEWLRRVQAEYTSAAVTQHLGLWLIQAAASPDLIKSALRIVGDEMAHARLSHETYVRAGGTNSPALVREQLGLVRNAQVPLEADIARTGLSVFCLGETVAVPLFRRLREGTTVPVARKALDRILRDEVRHRDFGWLLLDWLLEQPYADQVRGLAEAELPEMFATLAHNYGATKKNPSTDIDEADRQWGLMPTAEYAAAVFRTVERDWGPRFAARGIDGKTAWEKSERVRTDERISSF